MYAAPYAAGLGRAASRPTPTSSSGLLIGEFPLEPAAGRGGAGGRARACRAPRSTRRCPACTSSGWSSASPTAGSSPSPPTSRGPRALRGAPGAGGRRHGPAAAPAAAPRPRRAAGAPGRLGGARGTAERRRPDPEFVLARRGLPRPPGRRLGQPALADMLVQASTSGSAWCASTTSSPPSASGSRSASTSASSAPCSPTTRRSAARLLGAAHRRVDGRGRAAGRRRLRPHEPPGPHRHTAAPDLPRRRPPYHSRPPRRTTP